MKRREFLAAAATAVLPAAEAIIDIHQHTNYSGRTDEELIAHQRRMGITRTILLPAGSRYGLAAAAGGNETVVALAKRLPNEYVYFTNELPDLPEARAVMEPYLKTGAKGIGEQKYPVDSDSAHIEKIAELAAEYGVPVLLHFQHRTYNLAFERFYKILEKYPRTNFIGHAQTWWGNIDKHHEQPVMYPKTRVTPGGLTDRYLADYPNMFGDLSAGSGLNSMLRDEDHAREFLKRHQDKLLYGSDCSDRDGHGERCSGSQCIAVIRRLADASVARKLLHGNSARLMKL